MMKGKGIYINVIRELNTSVDAIADLVAEHYDHAIIKIMAVTSGFNWDLEIGVDLASKLARRLHARGVEVWGFGDVRPYSITGQVSRTLRRFDEIPELAGYLLDAETAWFGASDQDASQLVSLIKAGTDLPIGLTTFRYISNQGTFPWEGFRGVDFMNPQIYWVESHNAGEQTARSYQEYEEMFPDHPIVPAFPAYPHGDWRPTNAEIQEAWHVAFEEFDAEGCNFWDLKHCYPNQAGIDSLYIPAVDHHEHPHQHPEYTSQEQVQALMHQVYEDVVILNDQAHELANMITEYRKIHIIDFDNHDGKIKQLIDDVGENYQDLNLLAQGLQVRPLDTFWKRIKWLFSG